jgi:HSP20 family protein
MNIRRYESRYRPGRSLGLLGQLLNEPDFDNLLNSSLSGGREPDAITDWLPAVDIKEEADRFLVKADLPGVEPDKIEVTADDGVLTIQGSRDAETQDENADYKRYERVTGKFLRRFTLPDTANTEAIEARTQHGVLEISIPKQAKLAARRIDVAAT